jgi:hypothetical protein
MLYFSMVAGLNIPLNHPGERRRALEAQAAVGVHAWAEKGQWDAENDAEAYCLDAIDTLPAGSTRGFVGRLAIGRRFLREG